MKILKKYFRVWLLFGKTAWQITFINRATNSLFMLGKVIRLAMSLLFLFLVKANINNFAGYSDDQMITFFLTYQLIDLTAQVFYRGVYTFDNLVKSGDFDFFLIKPINPLFRALTDKPDINDFLFLIPNLVIIGYIITILDLNITTTSVLLYLLMLLNAFIITTAIHIFILVVGVLQHQADSAVWIYRELSSMAKYPVNIYLEPLRFILFFIVPLGMMITVPTEVFLNLQPSYNLLVPLTISILILTISIKTWYWSLKKYQDY